MMERLTKTKHDKESFDYAGRLDMVKNCVALILIPNYVDNDNVADKQDADGILKNKNPIPLKNKKKQQIGSIV